MKLILALHLLLLPVAATAATGRLLRTPLLRKLAAGELKLRFIDADLNIPLAGYDPIIDGSQISLTSLPQNVNVEAVHDNGEFIGSVVFSYNGISNFRTEGKAPYAFCGNSGGNFFACATEIFEVGTHTISATPYSSGGGETAGTAVSVSFSLVDSAPPSPTSAPELSPTTISPTGAPVSSPTTTSPTSSPVSSPTTTSPTSAPVPEVLPTTASPIGFDAGAWIEVDNNAPINARHEACFVMVDNPAAGRKAYLVGGRGNKDTDIYDPVSRTWSKGATTPIQLHHMQCVAAQGKLWVMSAWTDGFPRESNPDVAYVYDPASNSWQQLEAIPSARRRGAAAVVVSEDETKLYVSHGNNGGHETGNHAVSLGYLDEYDIASNTWTAISDSAPNPRDHTCGAMIGSRICVASGRDGGEGGWPSVAPTDCYNFATGAWEVEASIPQLRAGASCGTTCDGKLMVAGGEGDGNAWNNVDVFDGTTWTTIDSLNIGRHGSGLAIDCVCNQIHIASGAAAQGGGPEIKSIETFFPGGVDIPCIA